MAEELGTRPLTEQGTASVGQRLAIDVPRRRTPTSQPLLAGHPGLQSAFDILRDGGGRRRRLASGPGARCAAELSSLLKLDKADETTSERVPRLDEKARREITPAHVPGWAGKYVSLEASATEIKMFSVYIEGLTNAFLQGIARWSTHPPTT